MRYSTTSSAFENLPSSQQPHASRERVLLVGIVLLALVLRLGVAMATQSWVFRDKDHFWYFGYEMGRIGASLAAGGGFAAPHKTFTSGPTAWMPPVYPCIIGGVFTVFGTYSPASALVLEGLQSLISLVNCVLLFVLGKRLFNRHVGLIAAFILAVYPPGLHYTVQKIWSTDLLICGLLVTLLLCLKFGAAPSYKNSVRTGVSLGMTSLVDPISCAFWPFALIWLLCRGQAPWKTRLTTAVLAVVVCWGTITPWLVRNYLVFGRFVFIKSNFADMLLAGNVPRALHPAAGVQTPPPSQLQTPSQPEPPISQESQSSQAQLHKVAALLAGDPYAYLQRMARRAVSYWRMTRGRNVTAGNIATMSYVSLLTVGGLGICWSLWKGREVQLLFLAWLALPIPYYLTVIGHLHYRYPVEVLIMIFGAYALYRGARLLPWVSQSPAQCRR